MDLSYNLFHNVSVFPSTPCGIKSAPGHYGFHYVFGSSGWQFRNSCYYCITESEGGQCLSRGTSIYVYKPRARHRQLTLVLYKFWNGKDVNFEILFIKLSQHRQQEDRFVSKDILFHFVPSVTLTLIKFTKWCINIYSFELARRLVRRMLTLMQTKWNYRVIGAVMPDCSLCLVL